MIGTHSGCQRLALSSPGAFCNKQAGLAGVQNSHARSHARGDATLLSSQRRSRSRAHTGRQTYTSRNFRLAAPPRAAARLLEGPPAAVHFGCAGRVTHSQPRQRSGQRHARRTMGARGVVWSVLHVCRAARAAAGTSSVVRRRALSARDPCVRLGADAGVAGRPLPLDRVRAQARGAPAARAGAGAAAAQGSQVRGCRVEERAVLGRRATCCRHPTHAL